MQKLTAQLPRIREVDSYETWWFASDGEDGPKAPFLFVVVPTGTRTRASRGVKPLFSRVVGYYTIPPSARSRVPVGYWSGDDARLIWSSLLRRVTV
jgi:hypothetical protein